MLKQLRYSLLILLMAVCGSAWGLGWTVTMSDYESTSFTTSDGRFTISCQKNGGLTEPAYNANGKDVRVYAKGSITIKCNLGTLNSLYFNLSAQGLKRLAPITATVGTVGELEAGSNTVHWTAPEGTDVSEVSFTVGDKAEYGSDGNTKAGQLCFNAIYIDMTEGEVVPTPVTIPAPTFSPAAGEVEAGSTVTISAESDDYGVFYTLDGTSPVNNSTSAQGGDATVTVTITEAVTIKAAAKDEEGNWSEVVEAAYTVKAVTPVEEPNYSFDFNAIENLPTSSQSSHDGDITSALTIVEDGVTLVISPSTTSTPNRWWGTNNGPQLRMYGGTLTFSSEENISNIEFYTNGTWGDDNSADVGSISNAGGKATWTGSSNTVVITIAGKTQMNKVVVTKGSVAVQNPVITPNGGIFQEPTQVEITSDQSEATIYYTLDGSEPTNESTEYTGSFMLNETTTVKAIAYIGDVASTVTTATFTFPTVVNSIAEFRQLEVGETAILNLEGAQVTVAAGNNVYVRDAGSDASQTANAICFYKCNLGTDVTTGAVISGQLTGTRADFNGLPELTNATDVNITVNGVQGNLSWVKNVENLEDVTTDNYVADLIMFEGTVTMNGNNFFIGDIQLWVDDYVAAANSVYGGEVKSGDRPGNLVGEGKYYLVAGVFTSSGSNKTPRLLLMHVEETAEKVNVEYTFNSYGIGTLYYSDLRFGELPKGVMASYISGFEGKELKEEILTTDNGSFIPCGCPIILRGTPGSTVTLKGKKKSVDGETFEDNMLRGTDEEESCELVDADYLYYQLSAKDGEVGFYWGAEEGAPFTNGAHKAFLALTPDQAAQAPAFYFSGTSTGISNVAVDSMLDQNAPMYNLAGQRVDKSYKGVVIQNGVKVIKK